MISLNYDGTISYDRTDVRKFKLIRLRRKDCRCLVCETSIIKGSYCLGGIYYYRLCINCFLNKTIINYKKEINRLKELIKDTEKEVLKNKDKILENNVLMAI